jgi:MoaA/NifB/PqqE/SkfB family radical SAM enzyme
MLNNKKILCLGNNTEDTDRKAKKLSETLSVEYYGLLSDITITKNGCYQTSIYDWSYSDLSIILNQMDEIYILDQPKDSYGSEYDFHQTINIGKHFSQSKKVTFLNQSLTYDIFDILQTNKSLCILPWMESVVYAGEYYACCRSSTPISKFDKTISFKQDSSRNLLKEKMLNGELAPAYCSFCYDLEKKGIDSPRITETIEWARRLNVNSLESLQAIENPVYYEIRPGNKCNLMCRMCVPNKSSLIEKENKKIQIFPTETNVTYNSFDDIDINNLQRLYVAGGEPTISLEFYKFLKDCIEKKRTAIEIIINTNGVSLTRKFKEVIKHFSNIRFEVSVDGFEKNNQYVRWPTKWGKLVSNIDYLNKNNFPISFGVVVSIYTIVCLDKTVDFLSNRYPNSIIHLTTVDFSDDILSPYNFPNQKIVLESLGRIKQMKIYNNDIVFQSMINEYHRWFSSNPQVDTDKLKKFFKYNDLLDQSRDVKLIDYIPELEACRNYLTNQTYNTNVE